MAQMQFPTDEVNGKFLAARWHSRRWKTRIVWIEDGFSKEAQDWVAQDTRVQIIDTFPSFRSSIKGLRTGIRHWNINRIRDALSIQEIIEVSIDLRG